MGEFAGVFEEERCGRPADVVAPEGQIIIGRFSNDIADAPVRHAAGGHSD